MENFNLEKHWNDFRDNRLVVACPTELLATEFLTYCQDRGIAWCSGNSLLLHINWGYKEQTAYMHSHGMSYGDIQYYEENKYTIVEFTGFNIQNETKPRYIISDVSSIKIVNDNTNETVLEITRPTSDLDVKNMSVNLSNDEAEMLADSMYQEYMKSKVPTITTKEIIEVIYHGKETIVLIKTGGKYYKGISRCHYQDTYDKEIGFNWAYFWARKKQQLS